MVGIIGINVPFVLLDLGGNPFLPSAADDATFCRIVEPAGAAIDAELHDLAMEIGGDRG
ncbi:hypothetical protein [Bradyrhizobium sp. dw_78]|uniref:hypothetical protein n=1 Tax=Bradyrhizobium sp. dw_78 TaxID=2719793 RepID=UPI001BD4D68C|nr:hypothetical protein [Bradyrhizobium sp. dw_78]